MKNHMVTVSMLLILSVSIGPVSGQTMDDSEDGITIGPDWITNDDSCSEFMVAQLFGVALTWPELLPGYVKERAVALSDGQLKGKIDFIAETRYFEDYPLMMSIFGWQPFFHDDSINRTTSSYINRIIAELLSCRHANAPLMELYVRDLERSIEAILQGNDDVYYASCLCSQNSHFWERLYRTVSGSWPVDSLDKHFEETRKISFSLISHALLGDYGSPPASGDIPGESFEDWIADETPVTGEVPGTSSDPGGDTHVWADEPSGETEDKPAIRQFDWPPPKWTSRCVVPNDCVFNNSLGTLGAVEYTLTQALYGAEINDMSFYAIGKDGFALVARLECIEDDGRPKESRWGCAENNSFNTSDFSLSEILRSIFIAQTGRYRVIVLAVTDRQIVHSGETTAPETAEAWVKDGNIGLPPEYRCMKVKPDTRCVALVYEFFKASEDDAPQLVLSSQLCAKDHIVLAGLWSREEL